MPGKKILLVEDEAITALDLRRSLVQLGYEVPAVIQRGEDVMKTAHEVRPDIILMDIMLAGKVSGIEAAHTVRTSLRIPVIFLTAHSDLETIARAAKTEPFGYLSKPCNMADLMSTIEMALQKSAADARVRESEERFRVMADGAPVLIWMAGADGRGSFVNRPWLKFTGRTLEQETGEGWTEGLHPDDRSRAEEVYRSALRQKCQFEMEYRLRRADGEYRILLERAEPRFESTGVFAGFVGSCVDITDRRVVEEALRQSEENFRFFFDNDDAFRFVLDEGGKIIHVNQTVTSRLGYELSELAGQSVLAVHPKERWAEAGQIVADMIAGKAQTCPVPVVTKAGKQIPVETRVFRGRWNGRDVLMGISKDLSALKRSEEKFSKMFLANPCPMAIRSMSTGKIIDVNEAYVRTMGYTRDEVIGKAGGAGVFLDQAKFERVERELRDSKEVRNIELDVRTKDGSILTGLFTADVIELQDESLGISVMLDITGRKEAEEALRRTLEYNRKLLETSLDPFLTIGPDGRITDVNEATVIATGYQRQELIGSDFSSYLADSQGTREGLQKAFVDGFVRDYPLELRHREGRTTPVVCNASVFRDGAGAVAGIFAAARDVSQQMEAQEALARLNASLELRVDERTSELRQASAELESLSHSIAHDLRSPIKAIDGFATLISEEYGEVLDEEGHRLLGRIARNAKRMGTLIDGILESLSVRRRAIRVSAVDMTGLAKDVIASTDSEKPVEFRSLELPPAQGDRELIRIVLQHLVSNAVKFSVHCPGPIVEIGSQMGPAGPNYFVKDNGVGFDQKYVDNLFRLFHRLHGMEEFEGPGLGLALVKRIIERHGGRVWAEGEVNAGATFWFTLG